MECCRWSLNRQRCTFHQQLARPRGGIAAGLVLPSGTEIIFVAKTKDENLNTLKWFNAVFMGHSYVLWDVCKTWYSRDIWNLDLRPESAVSAHVTGQPNFILGYSRTRTSQLQLDTRVGHISCQFSSVACPDNLKSDQNEHIFPPHSHSHIHCRTEVKFGNQLQSDTTFPSQTNIIIFKRSYLNMWITFNKNIKHP